MDEECDEWWQEHYCITKGSHSVHWCASEFNDKEGQKVKCNFTWTDSEIEEYYESM